MWYPISFPPLQLSVWSKCAPTHFGWSSCLFCPFIWPSMPLLNLLYMRCVMAFKVWWHQIFEIALSRILRSFDNLLSNVPSQPLKFNIIDCYHHFMKFVYGKRTIATRTQTEYRLLCFDYIFRIQLASWIRKQSYVYIYCLNIVLNIHIYKRAPSIHANGICVCGVFFHLTHIVVANGFIALIVGYQTIAWMRVCWSVATFSK